jgi:ribosomal protein S18 acetylase RimI-like enzyme
MTLAAEPTELDEQLDDYGYGLVARTSVQTVNLKSITIEPDTSLDSADVRTYPSKIWLEAFCQMNNVQPIFHNIAKEMLTEHLLQQARFVVLWQENQPIATAMLVLEHGYAGLFDVIVHQDYRGHGYGRKLLEYMLWLAQQNDAHTAYLQVMLNNERALRLYESLGFTESYQYWYREKPLPI